MKTIRITRGFSIFSKPGFRVLHRCTGSLRLDYRYAKRTKSSKNRKINNMIEYMKGNRYWTISDDFEKEKMNLSWSDFHSGNRNRFVPNFMKLIDTTTLHVKYIYYDVKSHEESIPTIRFQNRVVFRNRYSLGGILIGGSHWTLFTTGSN